MCMAAWLSQNRMIGCECLTSKSFNKFFNQVISQHVEAMERYSASAVDRATVVCFFVFHEIGDCPRNTQYPVTDLLVSLHRAQSASQNALNWSLLVEDNRIP